MKSLDLTQKILSRILRHLDTDERVRIRLTNQMAFTLVNILTNRCDLLEMADESGCLSQQITFLQKRVINLSFKEAKEMLR